MTAVAEAVTSAARRLVDAFGANDASGYFSCLAPDATFVFYTTRQVLQDRAEYERLWAEWAAGGFEVVGCRSLRGRVQVLSDDVAVFTHVVRTRTRDPSGEHDLAERETIVFRREPAGEWLAVHEHLSPDPDAA